MTWSARAIDPSLIGAVKSDSKLLDRTLFGDQPEVFTEKLKKEGRVDLSESVVASVFVNRLQFGPHEDFATYPRTFERDCELLSAGGCDIVFAPSEGEVYPQAQDFTVHPPPALAGILEGQSRPGFSQTAYV